MDGHEIDYKDYIKLGVKMCRDGYSTINSLNIDETFQEKYDLWDFPKNMVDLPPKVLGIIKEEMEKCKNI